MASKKILGLDLGTTSIGWALVNENKNNDSEIIKLGVRVNPLTVDEKIDFEKGRPLTTNAARTEKRGARRNLQRYKLRRKALKQILIESNIIEKNSPLTEIGKESTHLTLKARSQAAKEKVSLIDFAKVLLTINKKRGYKSSRKAKNEEEGQSIDGMAVAKQLYDNNQTPGEYVFNLLQNNKKYIPDFYQSDLQNEFDKVWQTQKTFYSEILTDKLYDLLKGKNKGATWKICEEPFGIVGIKLEGKASEKKLKIYQLRASGLSEKIGLEELAIALQEINNDINKSSGYLGAISDRSKVLYFDKLTVGEYLYKQIQENPHTSLKNQVFYRQDYLDEFERIWETQSTFHSCLSLKLKEKIRDIVIFYQRKLKSQKGLISFCQFESWKEEKLDREGKTIINKISGLPKKRIVGQRVIPKSSPLFQEFKIWQNINNLQFKRIDGSKKDLFNQEVEENYKLDDASRIALFEELNLRGNLTEKQVLKILNLNTKEWKTNFDKGIEGNRTNKELYNVFQHIAGEEGYGFDWSKKSAKEIKEELEAIFPVIGIDPTILHFNANKEKNTFDKQSSFQLWHLLFSAEDDNKISEEDRKNYGKSNVGIKKVLHKKYGFKPAYGGLLANISFQDDYGSLSARAIKKIIPFLESGNEFSVACSMAGYNHSNSLTKEQIDSRVLVNKLEILPKNSLRNPVVEKILNQMINVVNQICDTYGKPDEIRIELARELKKSAKEREETTKYINAATKENEDLKKTIQKDFGFYPTKNDLVRYKLYHELKDNGFKTLFTNQYIPYENIYSKDIDIEHIIPKAMLYDDSFSNKTLAYRTVNLKKSDRTAIDFINDEYNSDEVEKYKIRVESLLKSNSISKGKYKKLLMSKDNLPDGFIERDLRNSQYIAKKAKELLFELVPSVVSTSGRITSKLREDWDLINIMKELNLPKYRALGLTEIQERKNDKNVEVIKDWTKRNDHRHHAMDALTVAFTTHNHIQYINNLNASRQENNTILYGIRNKITKVYEIRNNKKRRFIPPMPNFRNEAKKHISSILISFKNKNKVTTKNINKTKIKGSEKFKKKTQLTPRGQLHKETIYGKSKRLMSKPTKINKKTTLNQVNLIINNQQKSVVLHHLEKFSNSPAIAFDTKTLKKTPLLWKGEPLKEVFCYEEIFTIRKDINPDLKVEKVVDLKVKDILKKRLSDYNDKPKEAFVDLIKNPIWLNKEKGIAIKRVTITGVSNAEPLHHKKDHFGNDILDKNKENIPVDYVSTGNNHHVAIYKDEKGNMQEQVVSFFEVVTRVNSGLPIIDKLFNKDIGWEFMFTMKQNEMFIFPKEDFDPIEIDLLDDNNAGLISPNLFRVQKIGAKDYSFRHHLETTITNNLNFTYIRKRTPSSVDKIIKVRINHLGNIVQIGEY